jgi:hypothetical protein
LLFYCIFKYCNTHSPSKLRENKSEKRHTNLEKTENKIKERSVVDWNRYSKAKWGRRLEFDAFVSDEGYAMHSSAALHPHHVFLTL